LTGTGKHTAQSDRTLCTVLDRFASNQINEIRELNYMTYAIATRLTNGQTSISRPLEIPVYHESEDIGKVTQKRLCDCDKGIQEDWIGYDHLQHIFLAAGASFETKGEAIDYLIDCFNYRTTGKITFTHASKQHYDDSDDTEF
jgi:hypothetical protein